MTQCSYFIDGCANDRKGCYTCTYLVQQLLLGDSVKLSSKKNHFFRSFFAIKSKWTCFKTTGSRPGVSLVRRFIYLLGQEPCRVVENSFILGLGCHFAFAISHQCVFLLSGCLSVKPGFLLVFTHMPLLCRDVEHSFIPRSASVLNSLPGACV